MARAIPGQAEPINGRCPLGQPKANAPAHTYNVWHMLFFKPSERYKETVIQFTTEKVAVSKGKCK